MQLRSVNRKQLIVETLNHNESIQEAVTEKAAQFITGLGVYMNPQAKINKPPGWELGVWISLHNPCVREVGRAAGEAVGWCWGQHGPSMNLSSWSGSSLWRTPHSDNISHILCYFKKAPNQPFDRNWTHKSSSRISEQEWAWRKAQRCVCKENRGAAFHEEAWMYTSELTYLFQICSTDQRVGMEKHPTIFSPLQISKLPSFTCTWLFVGNALYSK